MSKQKPIVCACVVVGLCSVLTLWLAIRFDLLYSGPVVLDTPFTREYDQVYLLTGKLVRS